MGFFDDDPFESIVREFFQEAGPARTSSSGNFIKSEKDERVIDYIEEGKKVYFVFELPGYNNRDIKVDVGKNFIEVSAKKKNFEGVRDYLISKLEKGVTIRKNLPSGTKVKNSNWTYKNGVLEVKIETK